jgi:excinuclease ABC subunit A
VTSDASPPGLTAAEAASVESREAHYPEEPAEIVVCGAREHNLRDIDVRIPRNKLVVLTGPSGSGKSSLAFDTIYAEGQRRYVESLSAYARQFLDQMVKPDVESIDGLSPAISIEQRTLSKNPRSTVGTVTEIADYLRLLYARVGVPHCHVCGTAITRQSVSEMVERVLGLGEGARVQILAPIVRGRKGAYKKELDELRGKGFTRVRVDGTMLDLADEIRLARHARHDIDIVVDRLLVRESAAARLAESIDAALRLSDGLLQLQLLSTDSSEVADEWLLSRHNACVDCGVSLPEIAPRSFSFNSPSGACPRCSGLGVVEQIDAERIVPDPSLSLAEGAIEPWSRGPAKRYYRELLASLAAHFDIDLATPWRDLPARARSGILLGAGKKEIAFELSLTPSEASGQGRAKGKAKKKSSVKRAWAGVVDELERLRAEDEHAAKGLARYLGPRTCPECAGSRLRVEARHVEVGSLAIHEACALPIAKLAAFLSQLRLAAGQQAIAARILEEIEERLRFLLDVGLDYLTLDRPSSSLSGGEGQRIRLATQIGSKLMGVLYILDEPSIGLHPRDNARLLAGLAALREMGNSVIVVEHDEATIRAADYVFDMGPGAGLHGGEIVARGTPEELLRDPDSLTGAFLSGRRSIPLPSRRREPGGPALVISGCREHNLKDLTFELPLGLFTVVTGVSGSGKSTLVVDTLLRAIARRLHGALLRPGRFARISGLDEIDKVIAIDQTAIGRTPRSNPATYSGLFSVIRRIFSQVPEARVRGYGPGRFSFNVKGGRCESCEGDGVLRVEMHFLPDLFVTCELCRGRRYNHETLEVRYKERNIAEVLEMTVEEALEFMENVPSACRPLQALADVGLGYIHLGQAATTLSGGEAQRIKLAKELARRATGRTLYVLDEPTTGLHFADVAKLLEMLNGLVERGNTVLVIEHHPDVVKSADHVVDLGPEGGEGGGEIVVAGPPEAVARCPRSHTGRALAEHLAREHSPGID